METRGLGDGVMGGIERIDVQSLDLIAYSVLYQAVYLVHQLFRLKEIKRLLSVG